MPKGSAAELPGETYVPNCMSERCIKKARRLKEGGKLKATDYDLWCEDCAQFKKTAKKV